MHHLPASSLLRHIVANDYLASLLIAISWQGMMTLIAFTISLSTDSDISLLAHTHHWDAGWYQTILNDQYRTNAASAAFYPLFPLIVGVISTLSFGLINTLVAVQVVNTICLWLGLVGLLKIARHFLPVNYRFLPVLFFLSAPAAFFLHMFYSEALFIALGFWAYAMALERRWLFTCILLAILTACRLPALLFVGLCFLEFCRAYDWQPRKIINKKLPLFFLTPLGFIGYGIYLAFARNDFFAMFSAYKATDDWAYQVFNLNIVETTARAAYQLLRSLIGQRPIDHDIIVNHFIPLFCLGILLFSSVYLIVKIKGKGIPLGFFGILSFIMFTLNSNVVSVHRYVLACLGIYLVLSLLIVKHRRLIAIITLYIIVTIVMQAFLLNSFIHNNFAG